MAPEGGLLLLDEPGEPLGAYLRSVLDGLGALGDGTGGLVLPRLTGGMVCQIYAGVCRQETAEKVLAALLAGRRVWTPKEGLSDFGRGPLGRLVAERLWCLRRAGLVVCPLGELAAWATGGRERRYGAGPGAGVRVVHQKDR